MLDGFDKSIDLEKHIEKEHEGYEKLECDKYEQKYVLKWHFEKQFMQIKQNIVTISITKKNAFLHILGANSNMK